MPDICVMLQTSNLQQQNCILVPGDRDFFPTDTNAVNSKADIDRLMLTYIMLFSCNFYLRY